MATGYVDVKTEVKGMNDVEKLLKKIDALEKEVSQLNRALPKTAAATKKAGRAAATASGNFQRLGVAFRTTLAPITAIVGGLTLITKALNTTGERAANFAVIEQSLNGLVDNAGAAADELLKVADRLGKATLFDEEDFTETFKLFTSFRNIGVDSYERVATAAADMATKLGGDPKAAALQLAKAMEDPAKQVTALARSGTVFTEQQKAQIKAMQESGDLLGAQKLVLAEIEKQYGGASVAAGEAGFAGALDSAGEAWRDFLEVLGQSSESGAIQFLNAITDGLNFLVQNFDVVGAAATAVIDVFVAPFEALAEGIQEALQVSGDFTSQFRGYMAIITKVLQDITNNFLRPIFKFIGFIIGKIIEWLGGLIRAIAGAASQAVKVVTGAIRTIAKVIETFINSTPVGIISKLFGIDQGAAVGNFISGFADGIDGLTESVGEYADELKAAAAAAIEAGKAGDTAGNSNPFAGAGPKGSSQEGGGKAGGGGAGSDKAAKAAEKLAQDMAKQLAAAQQMTREAERQNQLLQAKDDFHRAELESQNAIMEIAEKYGKLSEKALSDAEREELLRAQGLEVTNERLELEQKLEALRESALGGIEEEIRKQKAILEGKEEEYKWEKMIRELKERGITGGEAEAKVNELRAVTEQAEAYKQLQSQVTALADTVSGELVGAFEAVIDGSKSMDEAMSDALANIGKSFIKMAMQIIQKQLTMIIYGMIMKALGVSMPGTGFDVNSTQLGAGGGSVGGIGTLGPNFGLPANANGGFAPGGQPMLVGERGPELFMPHSDGRIVSNETMNNYRPNGMGAGGGGNVMVNYSGPQLNFNGDEYLPKSAVGDIINEAAMKGAQLGQARTVNSLRNNRSTRTRAGV